MSVTFEIAANSVEEFRALESEGAPYINMSNANWHRIAGLLGITDAPSGRGMAAEWAEACERVLASGIGLYEEYDRYRVEGLAEVAQAAGRLGRDVGWG